MTDDRKQNENGREASHVKGQFMRLYNTVDSAVERLRHNPRALMQAHHIFLEHAAAKGEVPEELKHASGFTSAFGASYQAYQKCKPRIEQFIHQNSLSEDNDETPSAGVEKIMYEGGAKFCVEIGSLWLRASEPIDPDDQ